MATFASNVNAKAVTSVTWRSYPLPASRGVPEDVRDMSDRRRGRQWGEG